MCLDEWRISGQANHQTTFHFDVNDCGEHGWRVKVGPDRRFFTSPGWLIGQPNGFWDVSKLNVGYSGDRPSVGLIADRGRANEFTMTAKEALDAGNGAERGERLRRYETFCGPRRPCRQARSETGPFGSYPIRQTVVTASVIGSKLAALQEIVTFTPRAVHATGSRLFQLTCLVRPLRRGAKKHPPFVLPQDLARKCCARGRIGLSVGS